jgi:threonine synthase
MDIQVASNFERLLLDLLGEAAAVRDWMAGFAEARRASVPPAALARARALFAGHSVDEATTRATIARTLAETGELVDPHSAVGLAAAAACRGDPSLPMVTLATAHPAKFPDAVEAATGRRPRLPEQLADLYARPERYDILADNLDALRAYIRRKVIDPR